MRSLLLLMLALTGCGESPDDLFVLFGRTTTPAGDGDDDVSVKLTRSFDGDCDQATAFKEQVSADGGQFSFDLVRIEVSLFTGHGTTCVRAQADFDSGARVWSDLYGFQPQLELPELRDWVADLHLIGFGLLPEFSEVLPPGAPQPDCAEPNQRFHALVVTVDGGTWWESSQVVQRIQADETSWQVVFDWGEMTLRPEDIEDLPVAVHMEARRDGCSEPAGSGPSFGGEYPAGTRWASGGQPLKLDAGMLVPPSRGASCAPLPSPCPLTDGRPEPLYFDAPTQSFTFELTAPAAIRTVLLRGGRSGAAWSGDGFGPPMPVVTVRSDTDTVTVPITVKPHLVDDGEILKQELVVYLLPVVFWRIDLPRALAPSTHITVELDAPYYALGEVSLFE